MSPWFALGLAPALQPWVLIGAGAATVVEAKLSSWESFLALFLYCVLASSSYLAMEISPSSAPPRARHCSQSPDLDRHPHRPGNHRGEPDHRILAHRGQPLPDRDLSQGGEAHFRQWIAKARQYQEKLEKRPWIAFPLESVRRFNKIEGKHLAIVIALNLFVAVIPLIIIGYAFIEAFNPHRDVGNLLASDLHLTGSTAQIVRGTFSNAGSARAWR